ncbi:Uncharacterized protein Fot_17020 [Forsythia ovata]|uniref:Uncharacterized protein n=1 Tax=Forsythia ovata TaxID=205694 RepID=A0ABD1VE57_9LAMI
MIIAATINHTANEKCNNSWWPCRCAQKVRNRRMLSSILVTTPYAKSEPVNGNKEELETLASDEISSEEIFTMELHLLQNSGMVPKSLKLLMFQYFCAALSDDLED